MDFLHARGHVASDFACAILVVVYDGDADATQHLPKLIFVVDIANGSSCLGSVVADLPDVIIQYVIMTRLYPLLRELVSVCVPQRSERLVVRVRPGGASTYRNEEGNI